jgi:hypothetical protein
LDDWIHASCQHHGSNDKRQGDYPLAGFQPTVSRQPLEPPVSRQPLEPPVSRQPFEPPVSRQPFE